MVKLPDFKIIETLTILNSVGKAQLNDLGNACADAIFAVSNPLAVQVLIKIPGLDIETTTRGNQIDVSVLSEFIKSHFYDSFDKESKIPYFAEMSLDDGRTITFSRIKYIGIPVAIISVLSDYTENNIFPSSECLRYCSSQLNSRIGFMLSQENPFSSEITARRLFKELDSEHVRAVTINAIANDYSKWISVFRKDGKILSNRLESSNVLPKDIKSAENIDDKTIEVLWPGMGLIGGIWVIDNRGRAIAVGLDDKRLQGDKFRSRVKENIESISAFDAEQLARSLDRLRTDFKKLVQAERAAAITETAISLNHEINNPLTAILGNIQLMLMNKAKLPEEVVNKLTTIESSALKIRETTSKLMSIIEPVTTPYASGLEMIDIEKSKKKKPE